MISVIIPTLNEEGRLPVLLKRLAGESSAHEVIVVDGGSADDTPMLAQTAGVRLLRSLPGRGQQLAAGAQAAEGDILLFLHADSEFPAGGLARIEAELAAEPDCPGGNFRLIFDGERPFSRWLTARYAWIRRHGVYYGDSAVFVRRDVYQRIGGFHPIALMEDFDFNRRLERIGQTCCIEEPPLITSSRRFEGRSAAAIVWGWAKIHALYFLGRSPERLAKRYEAQHQGAQDRRATNSMETRECPSSHA